MLRVHSFESLGTYDGPGIRLVVFLQGCNFRCLYCANPDTINAKGESKEMATEDILKMAVSQRPFFGKRGGVTFSGGEPTFQAAALLPVVKELRREGIHVCVDSNGSLWNPSVEELFQNVDLVLLDVKQFNRERHEALTGQSNRRTLETARFLEENHIPFWLRYVLVQNYSAFDEDIRDLGIHFKSYKMIQRVEILPYHQLGVHKYEAMGLDYKLKDVPLNTTEQLEHVKALFEEYFPNVCIN